MNTITNLTASIKYVEFLDKLGNYQLHRADSGHGGSLLTLAS